MKQRIAYPTLTTVYYQYTVDEHKLELYISLEQRARRSFVNELMSD